MLQQFHIIVKGKVQGVGYRYFAQIKANEYGIHGWIKNRSDGSVEILTSGEKDKVDQFIQEIRKGNPFSHVEEMVINEIDMKQNFQSFTIHY